MHLNQGIEKPSRLYKKTIWCSSFYLFQYQTHLKVYHFNMWQKIFIINIFLKLLEILKQTNMIPSFLFGLIILLQVTSSYSIFDFSLWILILKISLWFWFLFPVSIFFFYFHSSSTFFSFQFLSSLLWTQLPRLSWTNTVLLRDIWIS